MAGSDIRYQETRGDRRTAISDQEPGARKKELTTEITEERRVSGELGVEVWVEILRAKGALRMTDSGILAFEKGQSEEHGGHGEWETPLSLISDIGYLISLLSLERF